MKLLVATDAHIYRTPDGKHWCTSIYGYEFWKRYLDVFDNVRIVARMKDIPKMEGRKLLVDGEKVEVWGIPFYQGPVELAKKYINIQIALRNVDEGCDIALLRMPSQTASMTWKHLRKNIVLAGEVVYNMMDDVNLLNQSIFSKIINLVISNNLKKFCYHANGVSYVTENMIQNYYPSYARMHGESSEYFETYYSTITLKDDAYTSSRIFSKISSLTLVLSSVAMNSERKGEKILIKTVKKLRDRGFDVRAVLIGDGTMRKSFEEYSHNLNLDDYVSFTGLLASSDEVRDIMLTADIYVFPTQGEGLPRGVLEAMAIGLPVLSSPVGGIPEIIDKKYLFNPLDVDAYVNEISRLVNNPVELTKMSATNYKKALQFKNCLLKNKRMKFYNKLKLLALSRR